MSPNVNEGIHIFISAHWASIFVILGCFNRYYDTYHDPESGLVYLIMPINYLQGNRGTVGAASENPAGAHPSKAWRYAGRQK
jgi:hypothetical protein